MTASDPTRASDVPASSAPPEVITRALLRLVRVPATAAGGSVTIALITLDNARGPARPNTFGPAGLGELDAAISAALALAPDAIAVTGKPFSFSAGADLSQLSAIAGRESAEEFVAFGQRVFARLREATVPTFAFLNGPALGGGLEVALHCTYRTVAATVGSLGQPEVFIGLLPGWGGTQLISRLAGPASAVTVIVENPLNRNRMLSAPEALRLGLVDVVLDSADFLEQSLLWAAGVLAGSTTVPRSECGGATGELWSAALERGRAVADKRTHGATPAAYRALEMIALARTTEVSAGLTAEATALVDLIMSQEFRAAAYSFDLVHRRARKPAGAPDLASARSVTKVGVIGAGLMAGQLALLFARSLHLPVVLTDVDQPRLDKGLETIRRNVTELAAKKRITSDEANRLTASISGSLDYGAFADADFVIEAVFEELSVKKQVFAELEKHVRPDAVLASNTSSLSISEMAHGLQNPERVIGFHFFNPVAVMPLLEIVRGSQTDDATQATALALAKPLQKGPILVRDAPAFVVNRLLLRSIGEVLAAIDEGTPAGVADSALAPLGLPMSPLKLIELTGAAVILHVQRTLHGAFGDRFAVSPGLQRIVGAGHRTLLTKNEDGTHALAPEIATGWEQSDDRSTAEQVRDRVLFALAQEARLMLDEGVVADAADLDLGLITGAGWPYWLGGITPYLDREGYSERATGRRFAPPGVATLPG